MSHAGSSISGAARRIGCENPTRNNADVGRSAAGLRCHHRRLRSTSRGFPARRGALRDHLGGGLGGRTERCRGSYPEPGPDPPGQASPPLHREPRPGRSPVAYYVQGRDTAVYFTRTGITFALTGPKAEGAGSDESSRRLDRRRVSFEPGRASRERWAVHLDFVGASAVTPRGEEPTPAVVSYFKGPRERCEDRSLDLRQCRLLRSLAGHRPRLFRRRRPPQVHLPGQARRRPDPDPARLPGRERQ